MSRFEKFVRTIIAVLYFALMELIAARIAEIDFGNLSLIDIVAPVFVVMQVIAIIPAALSIGEVISKRS